MAIPDSSTIGRLQRLLSELQRRKVIRVAAGYVVASWIILQVAASLENALTLPAWFDTVVVAFLVVGFPVALIASWMFEFTADGIKRSTGSGDGALIRPHTSDWILTGMLVVVLGFAVSQSVMPRSGETSSASQGVPEASVAVLPFENLSADKDNAFFATGIQDEILTRLTKIGSLKVISRTSTAHLASRPDNLPEIAKQLGVANILEGSVQRQGDSVRVNVQLIKAATDGHLWAEIYDRKLDNIFSVQSEIAIAIAEALSAKVTGSEKRDLAVAPTKNTAAYDAYLRGLAFWRRTEFLNAERQLQQAVKLDPNFAGAWALLAQAEAGRFHDGDRANARRAAARTTLETALRLQPELVEVLLAQAYHQYWVERDFAGARRRFEQVYAKWPNNGDVVAALGYIARRQGRWDQAKDYLEQAVALDPLSQVVRSAEVETLLLTRDFSAAQRRVDAALNIWPDVLQLIGIKAQIHQALGQLDQADETLKDIRLGLDYDWSLDAVFYQAVYRRRYPDAISAIQAVLALDEAAGSHDVASSQFNLYLGDLRRLSGDAAGAKANYILVRDELLPELKRQPGNPVIINMLALMYCGLGEREQAMDYAERLVKLVPVTKDAVDGPRWEATRARIWARFGDRERAIPAITRLLKLPASLLTPTILRLDPNFDRLRGDKRFEALLMEDGKP
ncbi:MAG: tetratricopeptide repeat protein [Alphaproteobacteria bacterium]|nr:tetratricopeptide repeat protein [Alphaproteobacteria bacterium]